MSLVLSDIGASAILAKYFNGTVPVAGNNLTLKLFSNNITPSDTDTAATYVPAAGGNYADKTLAAGSFTISSVGGIIQAAYAQQTFTFTGALTAGASIYGYYIVNADGVLIYAERAANSFTPANNGDALLITPQLQMSKGTPT
jgi:hypothetical protein